jgi:hypothetical protein
VIKGPSSWPRFAGAVAAVAVILLPLFASRILGNSADFSPVRPASSAKPVPTTTQETSREENAQLALHYSPTRL